MAFKYKSNLCNLFQTMTPIPDMAIANGQAIQDGSLVILVNGRVALAVGGREVAGIARIYDGTTHTGNAAGTVLCDVEFLRPGDILEVEQGTIADAACQAGDPLDFAANAFDLAAAANNDFAVLHHDPGRNMVHVSVIRHQFP
ncbi:MAG: hypothetical protein WC381_10780 [Kiritimatiellia bacterium]|jgi:hypothetical protein